MEKSSQIHGVYHEKYIKIMALLSKKTSKMMGLTVYYGFLSKMYQTYIQYIMALYGFAVKNADVYYPKWCLT
jgi:hypothetical protein